MGMPLIDAGAEKGRRAWEIWISSSSIVELQKQERWGKNGKKLNEIMKDWDVICINICHFGHALDHLFNAMSYLFLKWYNYSKLRKKFKPPSYHEVRVILIELMLKIKKKIELDRMHIDVWLLNGWKNLYPLLISMW